jgi:hypothetical protein
MGIVRRNRVLIAWMAMVVLMSNLVVAVLCSAPSKHTAADPLLGAVIICTGDGAETIPAEDQNAPLTQACQLCTTVIGPSLLLLIATLAWLMAPLVGRLLVFNNHGFLRPWPCRAGLGSRAPPLPA